MSAVGHHLRAVKTRVRDATSRSFWLRYATLAPYRAACAALSGVTGLTRSGSHDDPDVEQSVQYVERVFDGYRAAAGNVPTRGVVAEVGPGDSCGVGLLFLAHGCDRVDLVDRYYSVRDAEHQHAVNRALVERYPQLKTRQPGAGDAETSFVGLKRYYGAQASAEEFFRSHTGYDFIVSCAVLEHAADPLAAIAAMANALRPGGLMLHQVDCRDHGQFSTRFHELKFLELPRALYAPLAWGGGPNRIRLSAYLAAARSAGLESTFHVTTLAGVEGNWHGALSVPESALARSREYVTSVRPRLARPFRELDDDDLMTTSFMLAARKPD